MKSIIKNIPLLLILAFSVSFISCNDGLLSKFHQHGYKIKDRRVELMSYSEKYFNHFEIKTFKFNRTNSAANGTMNMKVTVKDKLEVLVQAHKFLSNEYRHFPVRFQINLRKAAEANVIGASIIKKCGNITEFSFEKDITYYACNFVIDETQFPPLIPNGRFKVDLHLLYLNEEIALISLFGEVYIPIAYPKK